MPVPIRVGIVGFGMSAQTFHAPIITRVPGMFVDDARFKNGSLFSGRSSDCVWDFQPHMRFCGGILLVTGSSNGTSEIALYTPDCVLVILVLAKITGLPFGPSFDDESIAETVMVY